MSEAETGTELSVSELPARSASPALNNLRQAMMTLSSENMSLALTEFSDRRATFRRWLMSKLVEGVHYGFPPGCQSRNDVSEKQYKARQSLYKPGAELLVELLGWRCDFQSDMATWEQLGKPSTVCILCRIYDGNGKEVGQGRGGRTRGEKKMTDNATIKMAEKGAMVNAVIHALSLSDLFTQDIEDDAPPKNPNPDADRSLPQQQSRQDRVGGGQLKQLVTAWQKDNEGLSVIDWEMFVYRITGREFNVRNATLWTLDEFDKVALAVMGDSQ